MRRVRHNRLGAGLFAILLVLGATGAKAQDDTALFSASAPPNVVLLVDNSGSMRNIVWHPSYTPGTNYGCGGTVYVHSSSAFVDVNRCGKTRRFFADPRYSGWTEYASNYADWIFSLPNGDPILAELADMSNGSYSPCVQAEFGSTTYSKYARTRTTAAKDTLAEVVCNVNAAGEVRFGIAQFRRDHDGEQHGGYLRVPIEDMDASDYSLNGSPLQSHLDHLNDAIENLGADTWTPLGETLFQVYTYFMSRNLGDLPVGKDGITKFPKYGYKTNFGPLPDGAETGNSAEIPKDPVQNSCQKHFVVVITDGEPTRDNFTTAGSNNQAGGFSDFTARLIGDYAPDYLGEGGENGQRYLDDIAKYMQENDFRPDIPDAQVIDTYTIGFTTSPAANALLQATANNGNGLFFFSNNADELTTAITDAITDILIKSQSFTAATVPATRTAAGGNLYTSFFIPSDDSPYWEGHLKLWNLTASGEILDRNDNCALAGNPVPCREGQLAATARPYWDAGEEIPNPDVRTLLTAIPSGPSPAPNQIVEFRHQSDGGPLRAVHLGDPDPAVPGDDLSVADIPFYSGSNAATAEDLAEEVIENVRGCVFGTGAGGVPCLQRPWLLGDIFHSNPVVVGEPRGFVNDPSYQEFRTKYAKRTRYVYAGSNAGFLHAFHSGDFDPAPPAPAIPGYDRGTGREVWGFMPWPARQKIKLLPRQTGNRQNYYVDGSPSASDVWFYGNIPTNPASAKADTSATKWQKWHTVIVGGLRQGGPGYYALDVTNPDNVPGGPGNFPEYLWEFPKETDPGGPGTIKDKIGDSWGRPIITKVKVLLSGKVVERWVAVITAGYDPTGDPNDPLNYNPNALTGRGIYLIDIKTGKILGQKHFDPGLPSTDPRSEMKYAFAATPAVFDIDGDGASDIILAGDLGGNMWKWVVRYRTPSFPDPGNYLEDAVNSGVDSSQPNTTFRKFFAAKKTPFSSLGVTLGGVDYYKSFFHPPAATFKSGKLWVTFGSGERANLKRPGNSSSIDENNRFYAVTDLDPLETRSPPYPVLTEADLYNAAADGSCADLTGYRGYFFLGDDGEKFMTEIALFSYWVIAGSYTPDPAPDPCTAGGKATLYIFRIYCGDGFFADTGAHADRKYGLDVGVPTDPKISVSPDGVRVIVTEGDKIKDPPPPPPPPEPVGQLYWMERQ